MVFSSKISIIKQQMLEIIFVSLFIFASNSYTVKIPNPLPNLIFNVIGGIDRRYNNEYIMINNGLYSSYAYKLEMKYDNITFIDEKYFSGHHDSSMRYYIITENLIIYSFMFYVYVENNGKTNKIVWGDILFNRQR